MKSHFNCFNEDVSTDIYPNAKSYSCKNITIFEPKVHLIGEKLYFDDYYFIMFFSKSPVILINEYEYEFDKGDLIVFKPSQVVSVITNQNREWDKYLTISVNKDFFEKVAFQINGREKFYFNCFQSTYSKQLLDFIGILQREIMNYGETYPIMIESICVQVVCQLIRDMSSNKTAYMNKTCRYNNYIDKALQIMQDYYNSNITINDICNMIYLSPGHFKRVFREQIGKTPYQYLMSIRLEKAKEIIRSNGNSMEEAARLCGFVNSGHFSTVFKRNEGMSPSEYRKICE